MNFRKHALPYILLLLLIVNVFVWSSVLEKDGGQLTVAFLDVGQGDAIFIEGPNGNQVLIDGGNGASVLRELSGVMPFYDRSIDLVIASHPDQDHIGGLVDVLSRFDVGAVMQTEVVSDTSVYSALNAEVDASGTARVVARRGQRVVLGGDAFLEILFPDRSTTEWDANDASIVARLVYGDTSFMLTGDAPKKMEEYIVLMEGRGLKSDVLKLGHHGSKTSTSEMFLAAVAPTYAIISAGKDNRYGHPHKEVMDRIEQFGIIPLITYEKGTLIIESDGQQVFLK